MAEKRTRGQRELERAAKARYKLRMCHRGQHVTTKRGLEDGLIEQLGILRVARSSGLFEVEKESQSAILVSMEVGQLGGGC